jgi:hypothetical protein
MGKLLLIGGQYRAPLMINLMRTSKLAHSYAKLGDAKLELKAQTIISALTGNENFPQTTPTLVSFTAVSTAYSTALVAAATRDKVSVSAKKDARDALILQMRLLAICVESLAEGNRTKLISSGFDISAAGFPSPPLSMPQDFSISDGSGPGQLKFSVKAVDNARSYIFEYTEEPLTIESSWISKGASTREYTFNNLPLGKRIYGRVKAIGAYNQESTSGVLSRIVQ